MFTERMNDTVSLVLPHRSSSLQFALIGLTSCMRMGNEFRVV